MQSSRTSMMLYDVPELLVRLSAVCPLLPGDIIFSGTPSGIGNRRTPQRFIGPDDVLVSEIEGIGTLTTRFTARAEPRSLSQDAARWASVVTLGR